MKILLLISLLNFNSSNNFYKIIEPYTGKVFYTTKIIEQHVNEVKFLNSNGEIVEFKSNYSLIILKVK